MKVWQPAHLNERYRILMALGFGVLLLVVGLGVAASMTQSASAQVEVGDLTVSDVNRTVDGVDDVELSADLAFSQNVPDAESRVVELRAGPSKDQLSTVAFDHSRDPSGTDSGTVTLSGSLLDASAFTVDDFAPAMAESKQTDVVVAATIEVTRENGETVTKTVHKTATVTLDDSTTLSADVGGDVTISVQ